MLKTMNCGLAAIVFSIVMTGAALSYTRHQQQACQGDAMRLCGPVIPDHARIHACLKAQRARISHACRAII
jgi:hypothetical protein